MTIILDGNEIVETSEKRTSVKFLRDKKRELKDLIDIVKDEPDETEVVMIAPTDKQARLEALRAERKAVVDLLQAVNLE